MKDIKKVNENKNRDPLVSIIVITYNSSQYVIETLESAKQQTYQNIELIISDDCSTDNNVEICRNWLAENKNRFVRTELITVKKNTGIAPNCNRGLDAAKGQWVKLIAGDDSLTVNCIEDFVKFVLANNDCSIVFGNILFQINGNLKPDQTNNFFYLTTEEQLIKVYTGSGIRSPASFIQRSLLISIGGFDINYPFIEDVPLWIKIANRKEHFYHIDKVVAHYRLHEKSISRQNQNNNINLKYYKNLRELIIHEIMPNLKRLKRYGAYLNLLNIITITDFIIKIGNKKNLISQFLNLFIISQTYAKVKRRLFPSNNIRKI